MSSNFFVKTLSSFIFLLLILICVYCNRSESSKTKLVFRIHHAYGHKVFLQTMSYAGQKAVIVDSAIARNGNDVIELNIPEGEERPYRLRVSGTRIDILIINDSPVITIEANIFKPQEYSAKNSKATSSVKIFLDNQLKLALKNKNDAVQIDSLKSVNAPKKSIDSLTNKYDQEIADFFKQYINYADTVSSSAAFLFIYNNVDFDKDYNGLKRFISKAAQRFPENDAVQDLKKRTLEYLRTFEVEYEVGNYLPELVLPDKNDFDISTYSLKGKYVFMDFWSTWCNACLKYDKAKVIAKKNFPSDKFEIVSIALDSEKDAWKHYIEVKKYNWIQLIDEKMWQGPTLKAYSIDSIPFNFLLAPDGRILSKAIKPDSVITVLSRNIK